MYSLLLILVLALALAANSDAGLSKLSEELLAEGLLSLNGAGIPTTVCMTTLKDGSSRIQACPIIPGFGPRSVGCFAVWNNATVMQLGCYSNQEVSLRAQCKRGMCSFDRNHKGVAFCCCHGPLCNADYA